MLTSNSHLTDDNFGLSKKLATFVQSKFTLHAINLMKNFSVCNQRIQC